LLDHVVTGTMQKLLRQCGRDIDRQLAVLNQVQQLEIEHRAKWSAALTRDGLAPYRALPPPVFWNPSNVSMLIQSVIAAKQAQQYRNMMDGLHELCTRRWEEARDVAAMRGQFMSQWLKQRGILSLDAVYMSSLSSLYQLCGDTAALSALRATFSAPMRRDPVAMVPVLIDHAWKKDVAGAEHAAAQFVEDGGVMDGQHFTALLGVYASVGDLAGAQGVWQRMQAAGVRPEARSFVKLLVTHQLMLSLALRRSDVDHAVSARRAVSSISAVIAQMAQPADGGAPIRLTMAHYEQLAREAFMRGKEADNSEHGELLFQLGRKWEWERSQLSPAPAGTPAV
jgi:hypothetical protein